MRRMIGAILLLAAAFVLGLSLSGQAKRRVAELSGFHRFFSEIRDGIAGMQLPLDMLFSKKRSGVLADNGFYARLCDCVRVGTEKPLLTAIRAHAEIHGFALSEEDVRILSAFARELGSSDLETEIRRCDYHIAALARRCAEVGDAVASETRITRILPVCGASLLILLLL